jgi:hypothetical protein
MLIELENIREPDTLVFRGTHYCEEDKAQELVDYYEKLYGNDKIVGALKSMISRKQRAEVKEKFWLDMYLALREEYVKLEESKKPKVKKVKEIK